MSAIDPLFLDPDNVEPEDIDRLIEATALLPAAAQAHAIANLRALIRTTHIQRSKDSYYHFASTQMPGFRHGRHIRLLAAQLDRVVRGECKRLIVAMPPRHSKSQNVSKYFPAYFLGHHPDAQLLSVSHTGALAVNFGREVRDIITTPTFTDVFPHTRLKADVKAAGEWQTDAGGAYYAAGVGANIAGRGAHLLLCGLSTNHVWSATGEPIQLANLKEGDEIQGPSGAQAVVNLLHAHHPLVYTVNQAVDVSGTHPFWAHRRGWVQADALRVGDYIKVEPTWKPLLRNACSCLKRLLTRRGNL